MNKELLFQLYSIHSKSGSEKKMRKFIKRYIRRVCGECDIVQDEHGNVFVTKGTADSYPCLASHIDQVQSRHSKDFECIEGKDVVFGYSAKSREQQGLGADDKNGIWICLECLAKYDILKCAFFVGEEIGCKGSRACDLTFFKDCRYIIQPDRMHGSDLITDMAVGRVCSDDFVKALGADKYGYEKEHGSITDVGTLVERGVGISCLNLSCGYYNAHSDEEFTVLSELQNCLDFVCHIVETLTDTYPFEYVGWSYGGYNGRYGYNSRYSYDYGYGYHSYHEQPAKSIHPTTKKYAFDDMDDVDYYDCGCYDEDYDMMENILLSNPDMTFDELTGQGGWISNFYTRDLDTLRDIYNNVCEYYGCGQFAKSADDDAGELIFQLDEAKEEEMDFSEVVFPSRKVS